eukprot:517778_1
MIYCNYTVLQYEFSKTFRKVSLEETKENIKERHSYFWHFSKSLQEAVSINGVAIYQETIKRFYHGIGQELVFTSTTNKQYIYGPLSTSSSMEVATIFTNMNNGIIIELGDNIGYALQLSVGWLSRFGNEAEHLFIGGEEGLQFTNIFCIKEGIECKPILAALDFISDLFERRKPSEIIPSMQRLIQRILHHQLSKHHDDFKPFSSLNEYGARLINSFFVNVKKLIICYDNIEQYFNFLLDLLVDIENNHTIKLDIFHMLLPNIEKMEIELQNKINTKIHMLNFFDQLIQDMYIINVAMEIRITLDDMLTQYDVNSLKMQFRTVGFDTSIEIISNLDDESHKYNISVQRIYISLMQ